MSHVVLTAEALLAGEQATFEIKIPSELVNGQGIDTAKQNADKVVIVKPLTIGSYLLILKAAKEDPSLIPLFMIKESLVEPKLKLEQIKKLRVGIVEHLVSQIKTISGIKKKSL